jgi:hydroxymethylbilane synthase
VTAIGCADTQACVLAERAFLATLKADCHSPVGALATLDAGEMTLVAELLDGEGREHVIGAMRGNDGIALGRALATDLLERAPIAVRRLFEG